MNPVSDVRTKAQGVSLWHMLRSPEARRLASYARGSRRLMVVTGILSGVSSVVEMARMACLLLTLHAMIGMTPPSLGRIVAYFPTSLPELFSALLFLTLSKSTVEYFRRYLSAQAQAQFVNAIRSDAILGVLSKPLDFFTDRRSGESVFIVNSQTARFSSFIPLMSDLSACVFTILAIGAMMLQVQAGLTGLLALCAVLLSVAVRPFYRKIQQVGIDQASASSDAAAQFQDAVRGIKLVKTCHTERWERDRCSTKANRVSNLQVDATSLRQLATEIAAVGGVVAVIIVASAGMVVGIPGAVLFSLLLLAGRILPEVAKIREAWMTLGSMWGHLVQVAELLPDKSPDKSPTPVTIRFGKFPEEVGISDLSFSYAGFPVLRDLSFNLQSGKSVALVGLTGSGKTTLLDCLAGLRWQEGEVYPPIPQQEISYLTQDPILMYGTVAENAWYGKPLPPFDKHATVVDLPWDQPVGESGSKLSGGQKQKVAVVRLSYDANIWLLDEPTSSMDAETEAEVMRFILSQKQGRIILVATHRLHAIKGFDRILVLHGGKIVEDGTHAELITRDGLYARLWRVQEVA